LADQWVPSQFFFDQNYLSQRGVERPRDILFIVAHHSAGIESSDIGWLTQTGQVSAHKYVGRTGNRYQLVKDENAAWGCAVDPQWEVSPPRMGDRWARNENWPALQFEMENIGTDPFTDEQYEAAADWVAAWIQAYGIPADRNNILGHRELTTNQQHQDPNDFWDWSRFMAKVQFRLAQVNYVDYYIEGAPTISKKLFHDTLAANPRSPITDDADQYYDLCVQYRINPAVALAFFVKESSKGTAGISTQTLSWGNMRRARNPARTTGTLNTQWGPFAIYKTWLDSLADWCENLLSEVYKGEGRTTVRSVIPKYAPSFENNTNQYIQQTIDRITQWRDVPSSADTFTDYLIKAQPTMSRAQFADVLRQNNSPALPEADALYDVCVNSGVNPAVALAFFVRISRAGTGYANPAKANNHNWGEIAGDGTGVGGVQAYPTWRDGLTDWIRVIAGVYGGQGFATLSTVLPRYRPAGTTDPDGMARAISDLVTAWKQQFDPFGFSVGPANNPPGPA
jgi:N-acetyl-anhydromuramyl-L-alanine amidase AmpD